MPSELKEGFRSISKTLSASTFFNSVLTNPLYFSLLLVGIIFWLSCLLSSQVKFLFYNFILLVPLIMLHDSIKLGDLKTSLEDNKMNDILQQATDTKSKEIFSDNNIKIEPRL